MIRIVVVDNSADSRSRIVDEINACFSIDPEQLQFFPRLSIKPLAPEEVKFHGAPDICIIGANLLISNISELSRIRRLLPKTALLVRCCGMLDSLSMVEHLARLGADDILSEQLSSAELLRKLILHARNAARVKNGTLLLVDSGKGGLGTTSIAAALGEFAIENGKRTLLVDFDFETQDLSRFLQVRPFLNEHLGALLNQEKPIIQELVEECFQKVWADDERLFAMTPVVDFERICDAQNSALRSLVSVFEILDGLFDLIIVDLGSAQPALRHMLYRIADRIVFIINNDPASLFASAERIEDGYSSISPSAKLNILPNAPHSHGLPIKLLQSEICKAVRLDPAFFIDEPLPFSKAGMLWPGSGATLYSRGERRFVRAFKHAAIKLELLPDVVKKDSQFLGLLKERICGLFSRDANVKFQTPETNLMALNSKASNPLPRIEYNPSKNVHSPEEWPELEVKHNFLNAHRAKDLISKARVVQ